MADNAGSQYIQNPLIGVRRPFLSLMGNLGTPKIIASIDPLCPYCHTSLTDEPKSVACSQCKTLHHQTCWTVHARCSVYGCSGSATAFEKRMIIVLNRHRWLAALLLIIELSILLGFYLYVLFTERVTIYFHGRFLFFVFLVLLGSILLIQRWLYRCPSCGVALELNQSIGSPTVCSNCGIRFMHALQGTER